MPNRRHFLKTSTAAAFGTLFLSKGFDEFHPRVNHAVGLQLYTLFNVMDSDAKGNLQKVVDIGYKEIESAFSKMGPFYGMTPKELASLLNDLGLSWKSHHVLGAPFKLPPGAKLPTGPDGKSITIPPMKNLKENTQELVDQVAEGGVPYLVCANIPTITSDDIKSSIDILNKAGEACKAAGITLAYHNHDQEFSTVDGQIPYEMFLKDLDHDVMMELDLCWAVKAGVDPVDLFNKHPGRFPLWHVKDLDSQKEAPVPVGDGIVDFKKIFANAEIAGMKHFFVEHDMPADAYASITKSYQYLDKVLKV